MRKTVLWWVAAVIGILAGVSRIYPLTRLWRHLETDDRFIGVFLGLLPFIWVVVGWKRPLLAGWLFIIDALVLWGWALVEVMTFGSRTGDYEFLALLNAAFLMLPLLIAGVLFLLAGRTSRVAMAAE